MSESGTRTRYSPSASFAPPMPPESATTRVVAQRNRSSCSGRISERALLAGRGGAQATDQHRRDAFGRLAHEQSGGGREGVAERDLRDLERPAGAIGLAAPVDEHGDAARPERNIDDAPAPRAPEAVADDHTRSDSEPAPSAARSRSAEASGSYRQEQHLLVRGGGRDIGAVDAGIRHDEPEPVTDDQHIAAGAQHLGGLGEHELDQPRVLAGGGRQLARPRARDDARELDQPALGLGDDLLGNAPARLPLRRRGSGSQVKRPAVRPDRARQYFRQTG